MKRERAASMESDHSDPLVMPAPAKRPRELSSALIFDRRVHFKEKSLYALCRSFVKNYPTDSAPPAPKSPPHQLLRAPLPQSELTRRKMPRIPCNASVDVIVGSAPTVSTEALLASHIAYSREVKKWWQMKRCHRLARYRDRLRQLNITVDASGDVHLLNELEEQHGTPFRSPVALTRTPPLAPTGHMGFSPSDRQGAGAMDGGTPPQHAATEGERAHMQRRVSLDEAGLASIAGDLVSLASGLQDNASVPTGLASPAHRSGMARRQSTDDVSAVLVSLQQGGEASAPGATTGVATATTVGS